MQKSHRSVGMKGSVLFLIMQIALVLTFVLIGGGGELKFPVEIQPWIDYPLVMLHAGLRAAAAAAEDHGATRADLRAIRTLLTTIFKKYKTEMQVGRQK